MHHSKRGRIAASLILFLGEILAGAKLVLDWLGRFDEAVKIKEHLPFLFDWPWFPLILIPLGFGMLWWTSRIPIQPTVLYGAGGEKLETPRQRVLTYSVFATVSALVIVGLLVFVVRYSPVRQVSILSVPASPKSLKKSEDKAPPRHEKKSSLEFRPANSNACVKVPPGKFYPDYLHVPGGPNEKRPWIVLSTGTFNDGISLLGSDTSIFFELTLVNRGETSIVKDWQLCLARDGKPVMYSPSEIPATGLPVQIGGTVKTIAASESLPEKTISTPVPHGNTTTGWIFFKIPGNAVYNEVMKKQEVPWSVKFKDYLDHEFTFGGAWNAPPTKTRVYMRGSKNP
jgi:hypothetical protein